MAERASEGFDEATVAALAEHLEVFAHTLTDRDRSLLERFLTRALDPWERMLVRDPGDLLSPEEVEVLRSLERNEAP